MGAGDSGRRRQRHRGGFRRHGHHHGGGEAIAVKADVGDPEDIAETVAFLAGPARWVNGQTLRVNGG